MNDMYKASFAVFILVCCLFCVNVRADLKVHLKLDGDLIDSAGTRQDGTLIDGSVGTNQYVTGKIDQALEMQNPDSTSDGDCVSVNYTLTDTGTIAMWFKPLSMYFYNTLFDNSINANDWECWIYGDGILRFRIESGGEISSYLHGLAPDGNAVGDWFHLIATWNRTSDTTVDAALYINGMLMGQTSGPWIDPGNIFYIGGGNAGNDFGDDVWDDVRIYDHVISGEEILWLAMQGLELEPSGLNLNEGASDSYTVALTYPDGGEPADNVYVTITPDSNASLNGLSAGESVVLTFENGTFTTPQTVLVTAVDDDINTSDRTSVLVHTISSSDEYWNNMTGRSLSVYILEDDIGCGAWGFLEMDFNEDCYVDLEDFVQFASQWTSCTDPSNSICISRPDVTIVAHRGYSVITPENTIASCNASRGYADMVEFDVRTTIDQQLILMHDATVDRTTDGSGTAEALTFDYIRSLDAGSWFSTEFTGELVPTLNEAILAVLPDMVPFIERKTGEPWQYTDMLNALRCVNDVIVISFDWDFLADIEAFDSTIITGALGSNSLTIDAVNSINAAGIDFIDWEHSTITADEVNLAHFAGLELWVWTVNDSARIQQLIDIGIDGITTDNPELVRQILDQQ